MKRKIIISFEVNPIEYFEANDTPEGAIDIAEEIICQLADFPDNCDVSIKCEEANKTIKMNEII